MKFAFVSKNTVKEIYEGWLNKYRFHRQNLDFVKIAFVALFLLFTVGVYFRFVSMSSTRGYFLRQANNDLSTADFSFELYKTKVLDLKQENWEQMHGSMQDKNIIDINTQIVQIEDKKELTFKE